MSHRPRNLETEAVATARVRVEAARDRLELATQHKRWTDPDRGARATKIAKRLGEVYEELEELLMDAAEYAAHEEVGKLDEVAFMERSLEIAGDAKARAVRAHRRCV
ncbi:hypothetical protein LCGC14_2519080 [marine sediment metagenome]|uniref:Uncharacterized protein n=1 Tax=marine sediment metagenome TaxID=412755 RepID=A0A0F9DQ86_9ZZZZ